MPLKVLTLPHTVFARSDAALELSLHLLSAKRNSRRSRILAAANIRAHAHVKKARLEWQYQMGIHDRYNNARCPGKFGIF